MALLQPGIILLAGPAAPGAIALINLMCTGLGGFLGPNIIGLLRQGTGGYTAGMFALRGIGGVGRHPLCSAA